MIVITMITIYNQAYLSVISIYKNIYIKFPRALVKNYIYKKNTRSHSPGSGPAPADLASGGLAGLTLL